MNNFKDILTYYFDKKTVVAIVISVLFTVIMSYFSRDKNFMLFYGQGDINIQYDKCLDSLDTRDMLDINTFKPRKPRYLVIHTTDSPKDMTMAELWNVFITTWGKDTKPGYNYAVNTKGKVYYFAPINNNEVLDWNEVVYGVKGYNSTTINIAYIGGYKGKDTRTEQQKNTLEILIKHIKTIFPDIIVVGHKDMPNVAKSCPNFDVIREYATL